MNMHLIIYLPLIKPYLIKGLRTINTICHAIKGIICLTETLLTSLLIPNNSIYIINCIKIDVNYDKIQLNYIKIDRIQVKTFWSFSTKHVKNLTTLETKCDYLTTQKVKIKGREGHRICDVTKNQSFKAILAEITSKLMQIIGKIQPCYINFDVIYAKNVAFGFFDTFKTSPIKSNYSN